METTTAELLAPAVETKDAIGASEEQARELNVQPEAEEVVGAGSETESAQQTGGPDDKPVESAEPVKEGDASDVAVVMDGMVAGVVAASEQEVVDAAEDDGAPVVSDTDATGELAVADESVDAAETATQDNERCSPDEEPGVVGSDASVDTPIEEAATSAPEEARASVTSTSTEETATETTAVKTTVTESTTTDVAATEEVVIQTIVTKEAATEEAVSVSSVTEETVTQTTTTEETVTQTTTTEKAATKEALVEEAVTEEAATVVSVTSTTGEEAAIELPATKEAVNVDAVTEEPVAEKSVNDEAVTLATVTNEVVTETATAEEVVTEKAVIEETVIEAVVTEPPTASEEETLIEAQEIEAVAVVTETAPSVKDDTLSREATEVVANAIVEGIIAEAIAFVDGAVVAEALAPHAADAPAQEIEETEVIATEVTTVDDEEGPRLEEPIASSEEQSGPLVEASVAAPSDSVAVEEAALASEAAQDTTKEHAEAAAEENNAEHAAIATENEVDTAGNDSTSGTSADSEVIEVKAEVAAAESVALESNTDGVAASTSAGSVESVTIEAKSTDAPDHPTQTTELATVPLDDEPKDNSDVLSSSHSLSSDEEGWRSDDNDSVDGEDASTKKKSRKFRSPVRSMISRFANKVSSSMPKKKLGAHRTESAAKLDLVTPSPVQGAVSHLETHREAKPETHRTESAAKLDLDGNSPVKHIVHRFESPQHNSLDHLKIRTVRTFFDEKERSIHVGQEKEKYDSALKSVAEGEATPKKLSPTAVKTAQASPKTADDAKPASILTPASPASAKKAAKASVEGNTTIDTTTVTPVKNMVSRFEKKPEQSLDNLSFRTVRTFFPTIEEPSIRVGAEKQKYEAVTEQQKAGVRRLEEEKLAKKEAVESVVTEVEATTAAAASGEEEHVLHVRDIAHQLEARNSLTRDLAPVSLSRSSSGTSERVDTTPVRITRSSSGAYETVDTTPVRLARSTSNSSDRSSVGGAALPPPSLSRSASASSDRPPRFIARSQSNASSHNGETTSTSGTGDEFHVKDVAQRFEARLTPSPQNASARVRRSSGAEVTLGAAHIQLRRASEPPVKQPVVNTSNEEKSEDEVFHVKDIAHRFESKQQSPVTGSLSRQSSGVETTAVSTSATAATPPRFRHNSSQGSATSAPATPASDPTTPKQIQIASNAVIETTPSANVRDIAHRFETNRAQSVETPAYRTMETFFKEVDEPSIRVRAEKAKLEALEKQKELEAKLAWAKTLHAEEEAAAAAKKIEMLHWFLMPAATNPAFVRLHAVLTDRDPMAALALFPRQEQANTEADLTVPLIPMDLPPFA